jgi:hypothetical protein
MGARSATSGTPGRSASRILRIIPCWIGTFSPAPAERAFALCILRPVFGNQCAVKMLVANLGATSVDDLDRCMAGVAILRHAAKDFAGSRQ